MGDVVTSTRRYYLLKRTEARLQCSGMESVWQRKQLDETGTDLPDDFPFLTELAALGYVAEEDLDGATECELTDAGLTPLEAESVIAAFADLS